MDGKLVELLIQGSLETIYMTLASTAIAYVFGVPLGVLVYGTDQKGIFPNKVLNAVLGFIINSIRSVPFLILLIFILPFTRLVVGTTIGSNATIVPLVVAATPFVARMVESSLREVEEGVIEAAKAMGCSKLQIVTKVLLPEAQPSLLSGLTIAIATILGYSAMAGIVGGGGLGAIAINYGYYRYQGDMMAITVVLLIVIVQIFQELGNRFVVKTDKRLK